MNKKVQRAGGTANQPGMDQVRTRTELTKTRKEQARTRAELGKTRREQTKTRIELSKTRTEQIKTRTELAKVRAKKTGLRSDLVEKTLQRVVHKEFDIHDKHQQVSTRTVNESLDQKNVIEQLTNRQSEILLLIAESHNTKQIAGILKVSPKTVEYHRRKLMTVLNVRDIPGLVRLALRGGLIPSHP